MKILFADDDPILREFAAVHLSEGAVEVLAAEDGVEALAVLRSETVDVLLVDLEMPRLDGFEVLRQVRADPALGDLPVMVITGREDVKAIDLAFERGATTFLTKPINWPLLAYQVKFIHRSAEAEALLKSSAARSASVGALAKGVDRLVSASVELLKDVSQSGDAALRSAADRYRSAVNEVIETLRAG